MVLPAAIENLLKFEPIEQDGSEADNFADDEKQVEKGDRAREGDNANQKYEEITKKKDKAGSNKPSNQEGEWEGAKVPKQNQINSTKKSKQRQDYQNKNLRNQ